MNFFKLYIGDYQRDTAHLSVTEHGAYLLMLQHYYATEKPLPTGKALHRMLRAQDKAERDAIDAVASQFWIETRDGLVNQRADQELTQAGAQAETNRAIAQAREAKRKAAREGHESSTNRATNDQPNHSQTPDTRKERAEVLPPPIARALDPDPPDPEPDPGQQPTPRGAACIAIRRAGIAAVNPSHPDLQRLLDAGVTPQDLADTAAELVGKGKGSFPLLLATVDGRLRDASAAGAAPSAAVLRKPASTSATPSAEETRALLDSAVQTAEEKAAAAEARRRVMSAFRGKVGHA